MKMESPYALWCLQMAHQTKIYPLQTGSLFATNKFYTRHVIDKQSKLLSGDESKILRTIRMNKVDAVNCPVLKDGIKKLENADRRKWLLVYVLDKESHQSTESPVAENCVYIIFKDRNVVLMYKNDLADTPRMVLDGKSDNTVRCVHGLDNLERWLGTEAI